MEFSINFNWKWKPKLIFIIMQKKKKSRQKSLPTSDEVGNDLRNCSYEQFLVGTLFIWTVVKSANESPTSLYTYLLPKPNSAVVADFRSSEVGNRSAEFKWTELGRHCRVYCTSSSIKSFDFSVQRKMNREPPTVAEGAGSSRKVREPLEKTSKEENGRWRGP